MPTFLYDIRGGHDIFTPMKKLKNNTDLFSKITDKTTFENAYKKALKGNNKYCKEAIEFANDETYNLKELRESLENETYEFDGYIRFTVYEPKERIVDAPHFKDKIVQLAINKLLKEIYMPCFIFDSYACLDYKGTHKCVDRIQEFLRKAKWEYGEEAYIVKVDFKKFFYSIDRKILKKLLTKKIKCKKTLRLIYKIIDSADTIDEKGLPLGNTLSQICANIYLNELDQYCKRRLSIKYMVRYMDDVILIMPNKERAKNTLNLIKQFSENNLNLKLNEKKSQIFPINQGVNAIGFKIYPTHKLLRNDSKKKIKRKTKKMRQLIIDEVMPIKKAEQIFNSWMGHAKHGNSYNFIRKLIKDNDYIYLSKRNGKDKIKVSVTRIKRERRRMIKEKENADATNSN